MVNVYYIIIFINLIISYILYFFYINKKKNIHNLIVKINKPIKIYDNFISKNDCDSLISYKEGTYKDSSIYIDNLGSVDLVSRSSKNSYFNRSENKIIISIENKIIKLLNIKKEQIEPIQIVKYEKGDLYKQHYDYFSDYTTQVKNQRTDSFIIYLNDIDEIDGGATWFPLCKIRIYPYKSRCIHFKNMFQDGTLNTSSLHTGEEILTDKIKYILTVWIRQYPYV